MTTRFPVSLMDSTGVTSGYVPTADGLGDVTWEPVPSGGTPSFTDITSGTNSTAAMVVGTGSSIAASGSGSITATAVAVGGITGLGTGIATFLATPSSANLATAVTDETGSGALVFADTPTLVTPVLGAATATSINGLTLTSSTGAVTIANGKTLTASNTITLTGTDGVSLNVTNIKPYVVGFGTTSAVTGQQGTFSVAERSGSISGWNIGIIGTGTCTIRVWKIATGTTAPTVSNNINTIGVSLSTGTFIRSTTTSDFTTTTVAQYDIFGYEITALSGPTGVYFGLEITAT